MFDFFRNLFTQGGDTLQLVTYALIFVAVCIPIACWRRGESYVASDLTVGDWSRLPPLFRVMWRPMKLLETSLGQLFALALPGPTRKYEELAEIAAVSVSARQVFVCKAILAPLFAALASLLGLVPSVSGAIVQIAVLVAGLLGWFLPSLALSGAAQVRQEEIVKSLPFAIDLMGSAMRAGLDFGAAMRYFTNLGGGGALEYEFTRVLRDASLGKPLSESLQDMAGRVRIKTFTAFAGVVAYGTEIGASIADTLKIHGAEMRRERFALAEQKAARAPSVMIFPLAVFIMPAVFLIIFVPVMLQFLATQSN